eukprot:COSAG01_NODE_34051_length_554_cov_1.248352_1_plen_82_part_10
MLLGVLAHLGWTHWSTWNALASYIVCHQLCHKLVTNRVGRLADVNRHCLADLEVPDFASHSRVTTHFIHAPHVRIIGLQFMW